MNSQPDPLPSGNAPFSSQGTHACGERYAGEGASAPGESAAQLQQSVNGSQQPSFIPTSKGTSRVVASAPSPEPHLGWYSRGYLPHWDHPGMIQGITFRLADSLPRKVLDRWRQELVSLPEPRRTTRLAHKIVDYLDAGHGACVLQDPRMARLTEDVLLRFDGKQYRMLAWCVMPNHVHALIETREGFPLPSIVQAWKSVVAHQANRTLNRSGALWQREYHDRYIRNAEHYLDAIRYIEGNPVKAGLVAFPHEWSFSSARFRKEENMK